MKKLSDSIFGFVGGGRMAQALAAGIVRAGLVTPKQIRFFDPSEEAAAAFESAVAGAQRLDSNTALVSGADIVVIAVKPQFVGKVIDEIYERIDSQHLVVSVAAGIPLSLFQSRLKSGRIVRVMPNTPCLIGKGASAMACASEIARDDREQVREIMAAVGDVVEVREDQLNAVTGLSGSGPAFVFTVVEALADGGVMMGLSREVALRLATQTVLGSSALVHQSGQHPAILRDQVASPGGTTIYGLRAMERNGVRAGLIEAVKAAATRADELSELA